MIILEAVWIDELSWVRENRRCHPEGRRQSIDSVGGSIESASQEERFQAHPVEGRQVLFSAMRERMRE
jgi:hypothetical protein